MLELLRGANINFGSPLAVLMDRLKSGSCSPKASKYLEASRVFQKVDHYHSVRKYHNDRIKVLHEMQSLWSEYPEASNAERLEIWQSRSSGSGQMGHRMKVSGHRDVPSKGRNSIKLSIKKNKFDIEKERYTELNMEVEPMVRKEAGLSSQIASARLDGLTWNRSKKPFSSSKYGGSVGTALGSQGGMDFNRKKKISKSMEKKRSIPGMKAINNDSRLSRGRIETSEKHMLDSRFERESNLRKRREVVKREIPEDVDSDWGNVSNYPPDGNFSSSGERNFMAEIMSDEEPSIRKRMKRTKHEYEEDYNSDSTGRMGGELSYRTPQVTSPHPGTPSFSFSVLHFLSAVRGALLSSSQQNVVVAYPFHEILRRVQANPGDLRVCSAREPLEGLVRGALKVLSSKALQPAVQGWKPLVAYDKGARGWCWIGPTPSRFQVDTSVIEIDTKAWGVSQKILNKIEDSFMGWFHGAQEMLQLLAQLGEPPLPERPFVLNENVRFQGLRAQRSLVTINPTTIEMRAYFQQEEAIRYSLQDTVFFYTTACGEKSAVAPLRRLGGKPNSKARDHLVLKSDRPSHVTILYLVRDAAARLPHSLGTRADVAVLLRDSQYIVEDASDSQLSQVVSGALDRLRYERDPCVQFDADRKLWVYLHADREEEDFEDDGTSSTKKSRRGKKDMADNCDVTGQDHAITGEETHDRLPSEPDYNSSPDSYAGSGELNYTADTPELFYNHQNTLASSFQGQLRDDGILPLIDIPTSIQSSCTNMQSHPMGWEMYR
ncbi:hypothetical protein KP509_20G007800 [Ceratopteris richardii]|nr:hypothetical protein KP509_20G007800 [Ceratopteris richardii]